MAENSLFFEAIVAAWSIRLDEETALEGGATISLETQTDMAESDVLTYIEDHLPEFLHNLRYLSKEDQELLLGYYILAKTQTSLALLHRSTQTLCSSRIRLAMKKMGTFIILGLPTPAVMRPVFEECGIENLLKKPLSEVVDLYAKTRSFQRVAEVLGLHRPEVRRVLSQVPKTLTAFGDIRMKALGAYVFDLVDKASASGQGFSRRKMAKQGHIYVQTSNLLGDFRIDVTSKGFDQIFVSRANR